MTSRSAALAIALVSAASTAQAQIPPDTGLDQRRAAMLARVASGFVPLRDYDANGDRSDCVIFGNDGYGLVARLELDRRGLDGGASPEEAAPWAQYMAESLARLAGTNGEEGRCGWNVSGSPAPSQTAAALAHALHRYGGAWPAEVKEAIRIAVAQGTWQDYPCLANGTIDPPVARILVGDALGDPDLVRVGYDGLRAIADGTMTNGLCEPNAPLYTAQHFSPLVFLQEVADEPSRDLGRILLDYALLFQGHTYLPGGGLGAPQSRDYAGGAVYEGNDYMTVLTWALTGDPQMAEPQENTLFTIATASDWAMPEIIRSIFLDKGSGYASWTYTMAQQGASRTPEAVYSLGLDGAQAIPWQTVMLPGGEASLGVAYGFRSTPLHVSSGLYVRNPAGGFAVLYQYQPGVCGDTDDDGDDWSGTSCGGSAENDDPDDFTSELYDYERLVHGRTAILLWDPLAREGVVRTFEDTRAHVPDWAELGGESIQAGAWRAGRLGDVYVGYAPLGTIAVEEDRGDWTYLRLDGRSGCVVDVATADEFATLADYAADLEGRNLAFTTDPLAAEVDARDPDTGDPVHVRLEYRPERRIIGGVEQSIDEALGHGLMESPWVTWDAPSRVLRLERECYGAVEYDWDDVSITEEPATDCGDGDADVDGDTDADTDTDADAGDGADAGTGGEGGDDGCSCRTAGRGHAGAPFALIFGMVLFVLVWRARDATRGRR